MITKDLVTYIKDAQKMGADRDGIERLLIENDWDYEDITEAFIAIENEKQGIAIKYDDELPVAPKPDPAPAPTFTPNPVSMAKPAVINPSIASNPNEMERISAPTISPLGMSNIKPEDKKVFDNKNLVGIPLEMKNPSQDFHEELEKAKEPKKSGKIALFGIIFLVILVVGAGVFYLVQSGILNQLMGGAREEVQTDLGLSLDEVVKAELDALRNSLVNWQGTVAFNENIEIDFTSGENPLTAFYRQSKIDRGESVEDVPAFDSFDILISGAKNTTQQKFEGTIKITTGEQLEVLDLGIRQDAERLILNPNIINPELLQGSSNFVSKSYLVSRGDYASLVSELKYDRLQEILTMMTGAPEQFVISVLELTAQANVFSYVTEIDQSTGDRIVKIANPNQNTIDSKVGISQINLRYNPAILSSGGYSIKSIEIIETIPQGGQIKISKNVTSADSQLLIQSIVIDQENPPFDLLSILQSISNNAKTRRLEGSLSFLKNAAGSYFTRFGGYSAFCNTENVVSAVNLIGNETGVLLSCNDSKNDFVIYGESSPGTFSCVDKNTSGQVLVRPTGFSCVVESV